jgi:dipeptidyl-peptidase-4
MRYFTSWMPRFLLSVSALAVDYEQALSLPKRTENLVFRDHLKLSWLPDGRSLWYRVQTGPKAYEFVLIDAEKGTRKTASSLRELGLLEPAPFKTSTAEILLRRTVQTGEESSLRFINTLDVDVSLRG